MLRWIVAGVCLLTVGVVWATRADALLAGHPAYPVLVTVLAVLGLVLGQVAWSRRSSPGVDRTRHGRSGRWRTVGRVLGVAAVALLCAVVLWLRPSTAAPRAAALLSTPTTGGVQVRDEATMITLTPGRSTGAGLIFQPGAKVDPRAYLPLLLPMAEAGHLVVIVKQPLDIGFLAVNAPEQVIAEHPEVSDWVVGGHSLGGVAAASFAGNHLSEVDGLLLWASYPTGSLADTELVVASVSATNDGLATPADIDASRPDLPPDTRFTAVQGAVHAQFGDYGAQSGDGVPTLDAASAQRQIVAASLDLLDATS